LPAGKNNLYARLVCDLSYSALAVPVVMQEKYNTFLLFILPQAKKPICTLIFSSFFSWSLS
jgi:hypothetical protein